MNNKRLSLMKWHEIKSRKKFEFFHHRPVVTNLWTDIVLFAKEFAIPNSINYIYIYVYIYYMYIYIYILISSQGIYKIFPISKIWKLKIVCISSITIIHPMLSTDSVAKYLGTSD